MTGGTIAILICMILVSGGVSSGIFQLIKKYIPEKWKGVRRVAAYILALMVALATSYLAGDVWHLIGAWGDGTVTAEQLFAYGTGIWATAEALYRLWHATPAPVTSAATVNKIAAKAVGDASNAIASIASALSMEAAATPAKSDPTLSEVSKTPPS